MKEILRRWRKGFLIGVGALFISTLAIQASDELQGVSGRLTGSVISSEVTCGEFSERVSYGGYAVCMDTYEASPSKKCLYSDIDTEVKTAANIAASSCLAVSVPDVMPWRYVTYTEAQQLCARAGKRLPTNEEWYKVAVGIGDTEACFDRSNASLKPTGSSSCVSPAGVYDLVGNVWEWMDEVAVDGNYKERSLPDSGYVSLVDNQGIVIETSEVENDSFGKDYAWISREGVKGFLRGGFYGSGSDGGIFSQNISTSLDLAAVGVGFRCVKDI